MYRKWVIDITSRPWTHAFLSYLRGIHAYVHPKTLHQYEIQQIHSMSYFGHTWIHNAPYFWGTHVLHAHLAHAISWNLLNISTRSHMHTWYSKPLENPCNTYTFTYMLSRSMPYKPVEYHYTNVPRPIPRNIGIPIHLAQSFIHDNAMHAICFVSVSLPAGYNPQNLFLRLQPPSLHPLRLQPQWLVFLSMRLQP
jgi:hypothetical protein